MTTRDVAPAPKDSFDFLVGGGEMARVIREKDWSATPLGPIEEWPQSLRTTVSLCLSSNFPIAIAWGPERTQIYNDGYWPICGAKHPEAMGQDFRECWASAWPVIGDAFDRATGGRSAFLVNQRMFLDRYGYLEETFFTFSFSPIRDESGGVGGLFHPVTELTQQSLSERRLEVLRELAERTAEARSVEEACAAMAEVFRASELDVPFAHLYATDAEDGLPALAVAAGLERPLTDVLPILEAARHKRALEIADLVERLPGLECGPYPEPPHAALILPIALSAMERAFAVLVVGVSPRRALDDAYRTFFTLMRDAVATALTNARAYEEECRRAEELAALDRAKTAFFSNVSHEFRTPLTLMLGPLEDGLADASAPLPAVQRERFDLVQRSALRLQKLVNTLLDFSRIEAGRARASYVATDLAALTRDLASSFRSAMDKAGLRFEVDCPPLGEPAWVDRDMWEKIVLNLLSNAFKHTFEGGVTVSLAQRDAHFELRVADTGTGIAAAELPRIFERFRRIEGARSRTHEGTGIGLALVQELAKLHGGVVSVESEEGRGTEFQVAIPAGDAHLPPDRIDAERQLAPTSVRSDVFVEEALRWLPDRAVASTVANGRARIVWADDNADLREYVRGLLAPHYEVEAVSDGAEALAAIGRRLPDVVITDAMMPNIDGIELVRRLRADAETASLPVLVLSARAGEESRIEGFEAGADDYLYKPFGARELLARVAALVRGAELRAQTASAQEELRESERRLREADVRKDEFLATLAHELRNPLAPLRSGLEVLQAAQDPVDVAAVQGIMKRQVEHLVRLVDDLLEVSRITRGVLELRREPVQLETVVRNAIESTQPLMESRRHNLSVDLPSDPLWLDGDAVRLAQIVSNLLNNAAKYTPAGGRIALRARADGCLASVEVGDNGRGIAPESIPRLFEMFQRECRAGEQGEEGLGIGLALARRLAELHGGTLEAHSEGPGRGSTFTLRVPLAESAAPAPVVAPTPGPVPLGLRVVVVDDNRDAAESLAMVLRVLGAEVRTAFDGPSALKLAASYEPNVMLLDIGMPGMDGYEVARATRSSLERPPSLIALTGWGQEEDRRRAKDAGFDHHLIKPADVADLQTLLASLAPGRGNGAPDQDRR